MSRPRHVLFLTDIFGGPHGGTEGQLTAIVEHLPADWRASLWVLSSSVYLPQNPFPCATRVVNLPRWGAPTFVPRLLALAGDIRAAGVQLIHAFHSDTCTLAPILGRMAGIPVITSRRDLGYWQRPRTVAGLRRANRWATRIVANCEAVARRTVAVEHALPGQMRVILNGHPPARFDVAADSGLRARLGIPASSPLIGLVANFRPLKRPQDLLGALARVRERFPEAHILFVSTEPPWPALQQRMQKEDVRGHAHVLPVHEDIVPVLKNLDLAVLCSETEGLSNAILEYMACGLPVVATDVGGNSELIEHGRTGMLYASGDVRALADALLGLLARPEKARALGAAARQEYERRFTLDRMVGQTLALWQEVLDAPTPARRVVFSLITRTEDVAMLESGWRALLGPKHFFLAPEWVLAWLESFGGTPWFVAARDEQGALVGLLPLVRSREGQVHFAGQEHGADHLDCLAQPGWEAAVAAGAMRFALRQGVKRLDLRHVQEGSALRSALRAGTLPYGERLSTWCPYILAPQGYEAWLSTSMDRKRRHEIRRLLRRFEERPDARMRLLREVSECEAAVGRLLQLHARRFASLGRETVFEGPALQGFHQGLMRRLAARGEALVAILEEERGRESAIFYGFVFGGAFHHFQSGVDEGGEISSPGTVLRALLLRDGVFGAGLTEFDFLDGDEAYKFQWATGVRRLFDLEVFAPGVVGRARALSRGAVGLARDSARGIALDAPLSRS